MDKRLEKIFDYYGIVRTEAQPRWMDHVCIYEEVNNHNLDEEPKIIPTGLVAVVKGFNKDGVTIVGEIGHTPAYDFTSMKYEEHGEHIDFFYMSRSEIEEVLGYDKTVTDKLIFGFKEYINEYLEWLSKKE